MSGDNGEVIDFGSKFDIAGLVERTKARRNDDAGQPDVTEPPALEPEEDEDGGVPPLEKMTPLPKPGDPYKAYSRPEKRAVPTLFVVRADGSVRGFPYGDLYGPDLQRDEDAGKGWVIVMRFARFERVTLTGRNLAAVHAQLGHHRISWVRELPKGKLAEADAPAITGVAIEEIER